MVSLPILDTEGHSTNILKMCDDSATILPSLFGALRQDATSTTRRSATKRPHMRAEKQNFYLDTATTSW